MLGFLSGGIWERIPWDPSQQLPCLAPETTQSPERLCDFPTMAEIVAKTKIGTHVFCHPEACYLRLAALFMLEMFSLVANDE